MPYVIQYRIIRPNGEVRVIEGIGRTDIDEHGNAATIYGTGQDVTARIEAEQVRVRDQEALQRYADRLRVLSSRLAEAEDSERQRIARELHDQVGQNLTALGINLNITQSLLPKDTPDTIRTRLQDSLALVNETTDRVRNVMADLRPPVLDDYGLLAALKWNGERFASRTGIAVTVKGEEPVPRLSASTENALFRIAQEALTNVSKHAQATMVTMSVQMGKESIELTIADNGAGFDRLDSVDDRGWGLLTMLERAEAVGGTCLIDPRPGKGTHVMVKAPRNSSGDA
jgi:two-component system sensor histidine kinase UhpB